MALYTNLISSNHIAIDTVEWSFTKPEGFEYQSGQHINIKLPQLLYEDKKGVRRTFTLSSAPHEQVLKITTRMTGSGFKKSMPEMPPDAQLEFIGPMGDMTWKNEKPAIFIAGGIGITPFKSMITELMHNNTLDTDLTLYYSNSHLKSAAFHAFFSEIDNNFFHYIPIITRDDQWDGRAERIDKAYLQEQVEQPGSVNWYLCGPSVMVNDLKGMLGELDVPEGQIMSETFYGY